MSESKESRMQVDKAEPCRARLCATCVHKDKPDDEFPCNCCWNPMGDMYVQINKVMTPVPHVGVSLEQEARDLLESSHVQGAQEMSAGSLVELASILAANRCLQNLVLNLIRTGMASVSSDEFVRQCQKAPDVVLDLTIKADIVKLLDNTSVPLKDHEIRELVNRLRDTAVQFAGTQQLRARIADIIMEVPGIKRK